MIIIDAGPMVALHDRDEEHHAVCMATLSRLRGPVSTTWPALTEAMHLLGRAGGWSAQRPLFDKALRGDIAVATADRAAMGRISELMSRYADLPMDLADASIVELCERSRGARVFTIDSDFQVYRMRGKRGIPLVH